MSNERITEAVSHSRMAALDGLRGVAVLLVLAYHFYAIPGRFMQGTWLAYGKRFASLGFSGVDLLFVLSGFLICRVLINAKHTNNAVAAFYIRRAFRILPIYTLLLLSYHLASTARLDAVQLQTPNAYWSYLLFVQNWTMMLSRSWTPLWLYVTWSLAIEVQFYLFIPLLIRRVSSLKVGMLMIAVGSIFRIVVWARMGAESYWPIYFCLLSRTDAFGIGICIASADQKRRLREGLHRLAPVAWISSAAIIIYFYAIRGFGATGSPFFFTFSAILFGSLLLMCTANGVFSKLMSMHWLRGIGAISYSLYLIHPVMLQVWSGPKIPVLQSTGEAVKIVGALVSSILLAALTWKYIEVPCQGIARCWCRRLETTLVTCEPVSEFVGSR